MPVDFSPDGKLIVAGGGGKREVNFIDAQTGKLIVATSALPGPAPWPPGSARTGPGSRSAGIGKPPGIRAFDPKTGKRLPTIETDLRRIGDLDFSRDGKLLAVASTSGVQVFDTASAKPVLTLERLQSEHRTGSRSARTGRDSPSRRTTSSSASTR